MGCDDCGAAPAEKAHQNQCAGEELHPGQGKDEGRQDLVVFYTVTRDGQRASGLRFGEPRSMAVLAALTSFVHTTNCFRRTLCHAG